MKLYTLDRPYHDLNDKRSILNGRAFYIKEVKKGSSLQLIDMISMKVIWKTSEVISSSEENGVLTVVTKNFTYKFADVCKLIPTL